MKAKQNFVKRKKTKLEGPSEPKIKQRQKTKTVQNRPNFD